MTSIIASAHAALSALKRPQGRGSPVKAQVEATAAGATVHIYDEIGGWGILAADIVPVLAALDVATIDVRLNSPGGDYFDGLAIANALERHDANITVHVDGLAASAASIIAMAGDEVVMHHGSRMMIHDALTVTAGNAADHEAAALLLDSVSKDIAELYATRAGQRSADEWRMDMRAERWFTAGEAVSAGLAHRQVSRKDASAPDEVENFSELLAQWRVLTPQISEAYSAAVAPSLSERFCSAYRKDVA